MKFKKWDVCAKLSQYKELDRQMLSFFSMSQQSRREEMTRLCGTEEGELDPKEFHLEPIKSKRSIRTLEDGSKEEQIEALESPTKCDRGTFALRVHTHPFPNRRDAACQYDKAGVVQGLSVKDWENSPGCVLYSLRDSVYLMCGAITVNNEKLMCARRVKP